METEVLRKNGNGSIMITSKGFIFLLCFLISVGTVIYGVSAFATTNRSDIDYNSKEIQELKETTVSKTEFQYIRDDLKEIKQDIKDIKKQGGE